MAKLRKPYQKICRRSPPKTKDMKTKVGAIELNRISAYLGQVAALASTIILFYLSWHFNRMVDCCRDF